MGMACREKTRNARSTSLSLLHIPYKDRCDWLPTLCLINTVLPSSPSFSHTLSVFHCPGSLAFQAFIGDCCNRDVAKTQRNSIKSAGNEIVDENKMLILNWEELRMWFLCVFDRFCGASMLYSFPKKLLAKADCTLMEDPEERLDEGILNGVALRPRVNSETDRVKTQMHFRYKTFEFR